MPAERNYNLSYIETGATSAVTLLEIDQYKAIV